MPNVHATFARDHEYKRHGTLSLLAGIDLLTGKVYALVRDRHRSREFIEFLKLLDAAFPASTAIKLILDNHSAHISRETRAWLDTRPAGRFDFTSRPSMAPGSTSSKASSPVISAWHQNTNSRNASWPASTTSIVIQSSTPGPISSPRLPDMISNHGNADLDRRWTCDTAMRRAIKPMERLAGLPGGPGARLCGDRKRYRGYFRRLRPFPVRFRE